MVWDTRRDEEPELEMGIGAVVAEVVVAEGARSLGEKWIELRSGAIVLAVVTF